MGRLGCGGSQASLKFAEGLKVLIALDRLYCLCQTFFGGWVTSPFLGDLLPTSLSPGTEALGKLTGPLVAEDTPQAE